MHGDAREVAGDSRREGHDVARVANSEPRTERVRPSRFFGLCGPVHPYDLLVRHLEAEGKVHLGEGDAERVRPRHRRLLPFPARVRLLGGLQPEPRDHRRAEGAAVALLRGVPRERGPQRDLLRGRFIFQVRELVTTAERRELQTSRKVTGLPLEHLEPPLLVQDRNDGRRFAHRDTCFLVAQVQVVVGVGSRVPRSAGDVVDEVVERIGGEWGVAVLEPVPSLRLPVDEPAPEGSLDVGRGADAAGELVQLRRGAGAGVANLADQRVLLHVAVAHLDVLGRARLERVPVRREHGGSAAGGGLGCHTLRQRGAGRGGVHTLAARAARAARAAGAAAGRRHEAPAARTAGPGRVDGLAEHGVARCGRGCILLTGGRHTGRELGDERAEAVPSTRARVLCRRARVPRLVVAPEVIVERLLRVGNLRDGHRVLVLAAERRERGLVEPTPLSQALLQPPVRHDALETRLRGFGPLGTLELVAHEVGGLAVEDAHVLAPQ